MNVKSSNALNTNRSLAIGMFSDKLQPFVKTMNREFRVVLLDLLKKKQVSLAFGQVTPMYTFGTVDHPKIYIVGLGKADQFNTERCRAAAGRLARLIKEDTEVVLPTFGDAQAVTEGLLLGAYAYSGYQKDDNPQINVSLYSPEDISTEVARGTILAEGQNLARDLANEPANLLNADTFAGLLDNFAAEHGLDHFILGIDDIVKMGMGGLAAVNQGSAIPARLAILSYEGSEDGDWTALVGKGVTFDSGGYNMKPSASIKGMKGDMAGASSCFGAFFAAVSLKIPKNVMLIIPLTDNLVSANAVKTGDVVEMMNHKTVEVTNTDAEGRLILGDALVLATRLGADRLIDVATLTGAMAAALGSDVTGAFTNDPEMFKALGDAASQAGERVWQMPLFPDYAKWLKQSQVADLDHAPIGRPGAIAAAAFLQEFVGKTPWIHLDIAGSFNSKEAYELGPKGATGVMARTLFNFLERI
ncbi:MAG: leucyl aminopeptidase [Turicibacter sp.]|nr:leucyl aminopeptidase [Turicibacter sp.]